MWRLMLAKQFLGASDIWRHLKEIAGYIDAIHSGLYTSHKNMDMI